jgi:hypothetical protein
LSQIANWIDAGTDGAPMAAPELATAAGSWSSVAGNGSCDSWQAAIVAAEELDPTALT